MIRKLLMLFLLLVSFTVHAREYISQWRNPYEAMLPSDEIIEKWRAEDSARLIETLKSGEVKHDDKRAVIVVLGEREEKNAKPILMHQFQLVRKELDEKRGENHIHISSSDIYLSKIWILAASSFVQIEVADKTTPEKVAALLQMVGDRTTKGDADIRWLGAKFFLQQVCEDTSTVAELVKELENKNEIIRSEATYLLQLNPDARAIPPLISKLTDPSERVRSRVIYALIATKDAQVIEHLGKSLKDDPSPNVRRAAAYGLGKIGGATVQKCLSDALGDQDQTVREAAEKALERMGN